MTASLPHITARVDVDTQDLLTKATAMLFEMPKKAVYHYCRHTVQL